MRITLTWRSLAAFIALLFVAGETHELVHTGLGRLLCGCWGTRNFNVWSLCESCAHKPLQNLAATLAGPLFSFALMWAGYFLLAPRHSVGYRSLGFALVFANIPFARILGAVFMGGNDEVYALSKVMPYYAAWVVGGAAVLLATVPPLVRAYGALQPRGRIWVFLGFFLLPTALLFIVILGGMNSLLASGFLATYWILGSPLLITSWTALVLVSLGLTYRALFTLGQPGAAAPRQSSLLPA
ncbi:hypothetical protein [Hymenobacter psoromatis]|uniref:hypothetical protein n=1 Tax=Hymenobacter psoromatis TaxID=1484116 RepID=UPI001CBB4A0D|nr:hypothetical protein [Hymenobacter psoromatis]